MAVPSNKGQCSAEMGQRSPTPYLAHHRLGAAEKIAMHATMNRSDKYKIFTLCCLVLASIIAVVSFYGRAPKIELPESEQTSIKLASLSLWRNVVADKFSSIDSEWSAADSVRRQLATDDSLGSRFQNTDGRVYVNTKWDNFDDSSGIAFYIPITPQGIAAESSNVCFATVYFDGHVFIYPLGDLPDALPKDVITISLNE